MRRELPREGGDRESETLDLDCAEFVEEGEGDCERGSRWDRSVMAGGERQKIQYMEFNSLFASWTLLLRG
jgi:hypothetical protein